MVILAILGALVLSSAIASFAYVIGAKRQAAPTRELAQAMRLLDKILSYDDHVTSLSTELRAEAQSLTRSYYKELT